MDCVVGVGVSDIRCGVVDKARGVSSCGGRQLIARVGDLRQQVHGFGVGGASRCERYSAGAIAYGSHGFAVLARFDCCFLRNLGWVSGGEYIKRGAGVQNRCGNASGVWILDDTVNSRIPRQLV